MCPISHPLPPVTEPARRIPVIARVDLCVAGGGCTGVMAAVSAARAGLSVLLVEGGGSLGGCATAGLVNVWHTLYDTEGKRQIIAGLTQEVEERLAARDAVERVDSESVGIRFNPAHLAVVLDELTAEARVRVLFHSRVCRALTEGQRLTHLVLENKDGRVAVEAAFFVDATGDGDVCRDLGLEEYRLPHIQPPTACFFLTREAEGCDLSRLIPAHGREFGLPDDWGWCGTVPHLPGISFRADTHVFGVDGSRADDLSRAETEGRRKAAAITALMKKYGDPATELVALPARIGVRDSRHFVTRTRAVGQELLTAPERPDTVMHGTYRVDMHGGEGEITFRYLDGRQETFWGRSGQAERRDWRRDMGLTTPPLTCYHASFSLLVQEKYANFIPVGRMLHADEEAFGALRVMVNLNQLGEAAGVAAALSVERGEDVRALAGMEVRRRLIAAGAAL